MKRYHVKRYSDFISESKNLNEGFFKDAVSKIGEALRRAMSKIPGLRWLGDKFEGPNSWVLNKYMQVQNGEIKGLTIYPGEVEKSIINAASNESPVQEPEVPTEEPKENPVAITEAYIKFESIDPTLPNKGPEFFKEELDAMIEFVKSLDETEELPYSQYPKPLLVWGAPGIGKTGIVNWKTKEAGMGARYCNLNIIDKDLFMLPTIGQDEFGTTKQQLVPLSSLPLFDDTLTGEARKEAIKKANCGGGGIIFFDEISRAPKSSITAIMNLASERVFENFRLAPKWIIVAASNRPQDEPDTPMDILRSPAQKARFRHFNFVPTMENWAEYQKQNTAYNPKTKELEKFFPEEMLDFLNLNPQFWHRMDPDAENTVEADPRGWESAARELHRRAVRLGRKLKMTEVEDIIAMQLGTEIASEYVAFIKLMSIVDTQSLEKVYTDPKNAAPWPKKKGENDEKTMDTGSINPSESEFEQYDINALRFAYRVSILRMKLGKVCTPQEIKNFLTYILNIGDKTSTVCLALDFLKQHPELSLRGGATYDVKVYKPVLDEYIEKLTKKYSDIFDNKTAIIVQRDTAVYVK